MSEQSDKLKKFMATHFDFNALKKAGFYKDIKKSDYEAQAERVRKFFGLESVYDYTEIAKGVSYHITESSYTFDCPICTCKNEVKESVTYKKAKCVGCKRSLIISATWNGYRVWSDDKYNDKAETYFEQAI